MTTKLQNKVWSILPKEFKEEVIREFFNAKSVGNEQIMQLLSYLFGISNLTSNTEGEEMLTVSRKRVQELYTKHKGNSHKSTLAGFPDYAEWDKMQCDLLRDLFGSKCLPDEKGINIAKLDKMLDEALEKETTDSLNEWMDSREDSKPVQPKYYKGEKVMYKGVLMVIDLIDTVTRRYHLSNGSYYAEWADESELEPYFEQNFKIGDKIRHKRLGYTGTILEKYYDYLDVEYNEINGEYTVSKDEVELI